MYCLLYHFAKDHSMSRTITKTISEALRLGGATFRIALDIPKQQKGWWLCAAMRGCTRAEQQTKPETAGSKREKEESM